MTSAPPPPVWSEGWYALAKRLDSPNFGARPTNTPPDLVVIHCISLPPAQSESDYGRGFVQQFFTNQLSWDAHPYFQSIRDVKVSAHFFIERTGELWQFVSCNDRAWHAGQSSYCDASGAIRTNCNDFSIGIELEGISGGTFTDAQYRTLIALRPALESAYPIRAYTGHENIAPGRKDDPGPGFDWSVFFKKVPPKNIHYR